MAPGRLDENVAAGRHVDPPRALGQIVEVAVDRLQLDQARRRGGAQLTEGIDLQPGIAFGIVGAGGHRLVAAAIEDQVDPAVFAAGRAGIAQWPGHAIDEAEGDADIAFDANGVAADAGHLEDLRLAAGGRDLPVDRGEGNQSGAVEGADAGLGTGRRSRSARRRYAAIGEALAQPFLLLLKGAAARLGIAGGLLGGEGAAKLGIEGRERITAADQPLDRRPRGGAIEAGLGRTRRWGDRQTRTASSSEAAFQARNLIGVYCFRLRDRPPARETILAQIVPLRQGLSAPEARPTVSL